MIPADKVSSQAAPPLRSDVQPRIDGRKRGSKSPAPGNTTTWNGRPLPQAKPSDMVSVARRTEKLETNKSLSLKSRESMKSKSSPKSTRKPYTADYETSKQSQKRIQSAVNDGRLKTALDRATSVLETFLNISPDKCNAANVVCALTLSAKTMGHETNSQFRDLLFRTNNILYSLIEDKSLSTRQLCNAVWALAKHYDRDELLLPIPPDPTALNSNTIRGPAELWDLRNDQVGCPAQRVDTTVNAIARQLIQDLTTDLYSAKEGELCMACWAYGVLRRRRRPPGWQHTTQINKSPMQARNEVGSSNFIKFEQWKLSDNKDSASDSEAGTISGEFLDIAGRALSASVPKIGLYNETSTVQSDRVGMCSWSELANVAWAFAAHGRASSDDSELLLNKIGREATRRLNEAISTGTNLPLSRDIAQIVWSFGVLQVDNFRLGDILVDFVTAVTRAARSGDLVVFKMWSCPDICQVLLALAHARIDDTFIIDALYTEACRRFASDEQPSAHRWKAWETSTLLWSMARLHLTETRGSVYSEFANRAVSYLDKSLQTAYSSFENMGIGPQEQANIAWSLTVLDLYHSPEAIDLLKAVYAEAATTCLRDGVVQPEHAHQLWQALFILQDECPSCTSTIPLWFSEYLQQRWSIEKSRQKISSARHLSLSKTLTLMGVAHYNEHDEDIDVAIVLKAGANWTHETESSEIRSGMRVAVEFDGPYHFTRQRGSVPGMKIDSPRALGHTVLKYRLLKKQGWTVVRVPYYEYDKIPFWASMERQRYLQRLLKTHVNLRFSSIDGSEYKAQVPNRGSRFD
jgi:RAP domain